MSLSSCREPSPDVPTEGRALLNLFKEHRQEPFAAFIYNELLVGGHISVQEYKNELLVLALEGKDKELLSTLLKSGAGSESVELKLLDVALLANDHKFIRELIDLGVNPHVANDFALKKACKNGQVDIVKELLQDNKSLDPKDATEALLQAIDGGQIEIIGLLNESLHFSSDMVIRHIGHISDDNSAYHAFELLILPDERLSWAFANHGYSTKSLRIQTALLEKYPTAEIAAKLIEKMIVLQDSSGLNEVLGKNLIQSKDTYNALLIKAIRWGAIDTIKELSKENLASLDETAPHMLESVLRNASDEIVDILIQYNQIPNSVKEKREEKQRKSSQSHEAHSFHESPPVSHQDKFIEAIKAGKTEEVTLLLASNSIDPAGNYNNAIKCAARSGKLEIVKLLLSYEQVDPTDDNYYSYKLAITGGHLDVLKELLAHKALPKDIDLSTELSRALRRGYEAVVELLVSSGQLGSQEKIAQVVESASQHGKPAIVDSLFGLKSTQSEAISGQALRAAVRKNNSDVLKLLRNTKSVEVKKYANDALIEAAKAGHETTAKTFFDDVVWNSELTETLSRTDAKFLHRLSALQEIFSDPTQYQLLFGESAKQYKGLVLQAHKNRTAFRKVVETIFSLAADIGENVSEAIELSTFLIATTLVEQQQRNATWKNYRDAINEHDDIKHIKDMLNEFYTFVYEPFLNSRGVNSEEAFSKAKAFMVLFSDIGLLDVTNFNRLWHRGDISIPTEISVKVKGGIWHRLLDEDSFVLDAKYQFLELYEGPELEKEGRVMGHCVGSYCTACSKGELHIFSLRNIVSGERIGTLGVAYSRDHDFEIKEFHGYGNATLGQEYWQYAHQLVSYLNADKRFKQRPRGETPASRVARQELSDYEKTTGVIEGYLPIQMIAHYQKLYLARHNTDPSDQSNRRYLHFWDSLKRVPYTVTA